jgi:hypothetical protein
MDPELARPDTRRRRGERGEQLRRPQPKFLGHDRGIRLDYEIEAVEAKNAAGARSGRDPFGDDRLERRHCPRQAELILEAQSASRIRQEVPDTDHRATTAGHGRLTARSPLQA